ncbi:amidohydrolase family protein [Mangrovivirga sp. M17]|uniref:Amidohydrolase family protein n=1 Tax=Mangrovivirga halotolerans TaxID=2993936 RepID=A0ABT3RQV8_9BACT|nr:amidohydrolase family protein [Mangrovivirga halotolerans]MCX2743769.1 amidohydrolase family protein [Mangrovivirga halotolerans]
MMKKLNIILICVIHSCYVYAQNLIIRGGNIVKADSNISIPNKAIEIRNGKIYSIGVTSNEKNFPTITLHKDDYILPGLFDLHAHLKLIYEGQYKEDTITTPLLYLANGVTTIFTCGDVDPEAVAKYKTNVSLNRSVGPRILNSGPYFGHGNKEWSDSMSKEEIYQTIDYWADRGVNGLKVKDISETHLQYVIDRGHKHGLTVTGHLHHKAHPEVGSQIAIPLGIDRLEHFIGGDALPGNTTGYTEIAALDLSDPLIDQSIDLFIDNNVWFNSTLTVIGGFTQSQDEWLKYWVDEKKYWTPYAQSIVNTNPKRWNPNREKFYENSKKILKRYYDRGGLISMGTDGPLILDFLWVFKTPGFNTHREMAMMSEIGIPNNEIIKIATINSATSMGLEEKLGSIEKGKLADIIIIKGNPLEDIYSTRSVHTVIKNGEIYDSRTILAQCEGKLGPESEEKWFKK